MHISWISVADRLPQHDTVVLGVLVWSFTRMVVMARYNEDGKEQWATIEGSRVKISHWMNLPTLPPE